MIPRTSPTRVCLFLVGCTLCSAFTSIGTKQHVSRALSPASFLLADQTNNNEDNEAVSSSSDLVARGLKRAAATFASVVVTASVLQPVTISHAVQPTLTEAIVEVSKTSYPILRELDPTNFREFSTKIGDVLLRINPDKLGKSIELGIDYLDSAPPEKLADFNAILKEAYADINTDSCKMVPLPPMSIVEKFSSLASEKVDPDKLKTFQETWKPSLEALKKTDESICLPANTGSLDKLALAQADLGRTFGKAETKAFGSYAGPLLKSSITPGKALSFVNDAKGLTPNASSQVKKDFAAAGKKVESASQLEMARNKMAEQKAKQAANKAALASKK